MRTVSESSDRRQHAADTRPGHAATSTAPQIGQKRRLSPELDDDEPSTPSSVKRMRREDTEMIDVEEQEVSQASGSTSQDVKEGVKEVTQGVKEVELEDIKEDGVAEAVESAAAVPLPDFPVLEIGRAHV